MNIENVAFYNLGALEPIPGYGENGLVRVPERVRRHLNERARFVGQSSVGIEIRFVTDAPIVDVYISVMEPEFSPRGTLRVYKGNLEVTTIEVVPGVMKFYRIQNPKWEEGCAGENMFKQGGFSKDVWRIICDQSTYILQGIDVHGHEIHPPKPEELPACNWLAYGSSITNANLDGFIDVAAKYLKIQVQNKGFSGSCHLEKELVDYLLDECEYDFMTFELGINMRGRYTVEEFRKRAAYLINRLAVLSKPAVIISTFPNKHTGGYIAADAAQSDLEQSLREAEYEKILEELVLHVGCKKLMFIKGEEILTDMTGLRADLLHPTTYGSAVMGLKLAERLKPFLQEWGVIEHSNAALQEKCHIIPKDPEIQVENGRILFGKRLNNIENPYIVTKTEPHCVITKIKPEKEAEYKKLHDEIWDLVVKNGHLYHVRNYSIVKFEDMYVSFFEYIGDNFEEDMQKKNCLPITKKWQKLCKECYVEIDGKPELVFFDRF